MATIRQINANQHNSLKSTGPKTDEGKTASRANALKHGLAGVGIVLPDEERAEIAERTEPWHDALKPSTEAEAWLVDIVATEAVRVERCRAIEANLREEEARRAGETWNQDRRLAAAKLGIKLSKRPEVVALELATTTQGVDLLLDRWRGLAQILESGGWTDAQKSLALDLLGIAHDQRELGLSPLHEVTRPGGVGLAPFVAEQINTLLALKPILDARDGREQASAMLGLGASSPELNRIHRYETASLRRIQWAYKCLKSTSIAPKPQARPTPPVATPPAPPLRVNGHLTDAMDDEQFLKEMEILTNAQEEYEREFGLRVEKGKGRLVAAGRTG